MWHCKVLRISDKQSNMLLKYAIVVQSAAQGDILLLDLVTHFWLLVHVGWLMYKYSGAASGI